jgi:hypothetical protein
MNVNPEAIGGVASDTPANDNIANRRHKVASDLNAYPESFNQGTACAGYYP